MSDIIKNAFANIDPNNKQFIKKNTNIVEEIYNLIAEKGLDQKQFSKLLKKNESEVSKWLSGVHNLTLRSIAKMEVALGEDIILTNTNARVRYEKVKYVLLKNEAKANNRFLNTRPENRVTLKIAQ